MLVPSLVGSDGFVGSWMCWSRWDAHWANGINVVLQAREWQQERQEAEPWTRLRFINRDFSTYNPNDLSACEFEAKGSHIFRQGGGTWVRPSFLGLPSAAAAYSRH